MPKPNKKLLLYDLEIRTQLNKQTKNNKKSSNGKSYWFLNHKSQLFLIKSNSIPARLTMISFIYFSSAEALMRTETTLNTKQ